MKYIRKKRIILIGVLLIGIIYMISAGVIVTGYKEKEWSLPHDVAIFPVLNDKSSPGSSNIFDSAPQIAPHISHIANNTLVVVQVLSQHIWLAIPPLISTLFSQWPHRMVVSDSSAIIGSLPVIDVVAQLHSDVIRESSELKPYRVRRLGNDQSWGWAQHEYVGVNDEELKRIITEQSLVQVNNYLQSAQGDEIQWVILCDPDVFFSARALSMSTTDETGLKSYDGKFVLIHRKDIEQYSKTHNLPATLKTVYNGKISTHTITKESWCDPIITLTNLNRWELQTLYGRDMREETDPLGSGFYRDFIMPYVKQSIPNWEIFPSSILKNIKMNNYKECLQACEQEENCLGWQWRDDKECGLETIGIRRGKRSKPFSMDEDNPQVISGWMIERINKIRLNAECDTLKVTENGSL